MKKPNHSSAAAKAHPAPERKSYPSGAEYAEACRLVSKARTAFDASKMTTAQKLDAIGIDAICEKVANCTTLQVIADEAGVSKASLIVWLDKHSDQYARAREAQADKMAEDILAIADDGGFEPVLVDGVPLMQGDKPVMAVSNAAVQQAKLRVDARKWLAGKMAPKKYGDRLNLDAEVKVSDLPDDQVEAKLIALMAKAQGKT